MDAQGQAVHTETVVWTTPITQLKYDVKGIDNVKVTKETGNNTNTYSVQVEAAMPKVFYMPPVVFNTKKTGRGERDLYLEYVEMFTRNGATTNSKVKDMPSLPAIVKSNSAIDVTIPVYERHQLDFFVVYYDQNVFSGVKFEGENGVLKYSIDKQAKHGSFMTIVMVYNGKDRTATSTGK